MLVSQVIKEREDISFMNGKAEGRAEGKAEGKAEEKRETARKFLQLGLDCKTVAAGTGLSLEEVEALKKG